MITETVVDEASALLRLDDIDVYLYINPLEPDHACGAYDTFRAWHSDKYDAGSRLSTYGC